MSSKTTKPEQSASQITKFREAAQELETDVDEDRFDQRLSTIARSPPAKVPKPENDEPAK